MERTYSTSLQARAAAELERRKRTSSGGGKYGTFKIKYKNDPVGFIRDCIYWREGEGPTIYQSKAAETLVEKRRVAVRGPHGLGKTALAALIVLWFALTRDGEDWKIPTTASAWRQLTKYLWPEIRKWSRRLRWDVIGRAPFNERTELLSLSLKLESGEAFALASDNSDLIEGAHADNLLYLFDESKSIPAPTWDSAEGAFSVGDVYWLAISTPGEPNGRFYDIHRRAPGYEDWDALHVTLEDAIEAGRVSREWALQRKKQWGADSAVYKNRVLGEFATSAEDTIIDLALVERANEIYYDWIEAGRPGTFKNVGVDVGRGGDKSVFAKRFEWYEDPEENGDPILKASVIDKLIYSSRKDTMAITGKTVGILNRYKKDKGFAVIDSLGIGAGVYDRIREQGLDVTGFVASEGTKIKDRSGEMGFKNKRAAAWWTMRVLLEDEVIGLPPDDLLTGDLTAPKWKEYSGGKIGVESKEEVKKRIGRSTDSGDAAIMALFESRKQVILFEV